MVKLRPYVVAVNHVPGCPRLESGQDGRKQGRQRCAPGCERRTDGWEVDLALRLPDGTRIRERLKAPLAAKSAALRWGQQREAYLLAERGGRSEKTIENEKATETSITLEAYARGWLEDRRARDVGAYFDERSRFRSHIVPALGQLRLGEIRPHHVRDFLRELRAKPSVRGGTLAPRSVRHVYATLRQALHDAVVDELIVANPVQVKKSDLPAKADKDPRWRKTAVFAHEEVELLISPNDAVPDDRRVAYAVEFLTGARPGEVSALRWRDYDRSAEPLGRLSDVFDGYTSPPWASLCEQVACLRVGLNEGRVVPFPSAGVGDILETGSASTPKPRSSM